LCAGLRVCWALSQLRATLNSLFSSSKGHLLGAAVGAGVALIALALRYPASSVPMTVATILLFCGVLAYVLLRQ
jgi:hypothetical protein